MAEMEAAAATYLSLARPLNCATTQWYDTMEEVYGPDGYLDADEFAVAGGRLISESGVLADALRTFADGLDAAAWPSTVASEVAELSDTTRNQSAGYAAMARATDVASFGRAVADSRFAERPNLELRAKLGLTRAVGDGCVEAPAGEYWFAPTDGVDLLAVGDSLVMVGGAFEARLLSMATGVELEYVNYEETESDGDPEDQFLDIGSGHEPVEITVGERTIDVVPDEGRIVSSPPTEGFVPAANPLVSGDFTISNSLEGLVVTSVDGGAWTFGVEGPMFDESPVVVADGWLFAGTSSGIVVAVRLDRSDLDAAAAAWLLQQ